MSSDVKQVFGTVLTVVGYVLIATGYGAGVGYALIAVGAGLSYSGARQAAKEAQAEAQKRAKAANASQAIKGNFRGSAEIHRLVFGEVRVGGIIVALGPGRSAGLFPDAYQLHIGVAHSIAHPGGCEGITAIWIDDTPILLAGLSADPNSAEAYATDAKWIAGSDNMVKVRHHKGTGTQTADATFVADGIEGSTAYRRGIAWTRFTLTRPRGGDYDEHFRKAFARGIPTVAVTLKGNKVYDPRLDSTNGGSGAHRYSDPLTWTYSRNSALCAATYMIMEKSDGGMGRVPTSIDWPSVAAAANICDETVNTVPRYACNIALLTSDADEVNLRNILDTMAGECIPVDGKYKLYAGAYRAPTFTLDESWVRGKITVKTRSPLDRLYNAVRVLHDDAAQNWRQVEAEPFIDAAYETDDGGERLWREEILEGVTESRQAQRIAQLWGRRSRAQRVIEVPCNLKALDVECWENGQITLSEIGLAGAVHRVIDWTWDGLGPVLILQQESSSYYDGAAYTAPDTTGAPAVTLEKPPAPSGFVGISEGDAAELSWDAPGPAEIKQVDVYRGTAPGGPYTLIDKAVGFFYRDTDVVPGTYYYVLRSRSHYGEQSVDSSEVSVTVAVTTGTGSLPLGNNGFEDGDVYWTKGTGWAISSDDPTARGGTWRAVFTGTTEAALKNQREISVAEGERVNAWGFVRSTAGASGAARGRIAWLSAAGAELSFSDATSITATTAYTQTRVGATAPAGAAFARFDFVASAPSGGTWYADDAFISVMPKNLDDVPDGTTYARPLGTALTSGQVDMTRPGVINRTADNISEGATRKWAAESGAQVVTGKSVDILSDGTTYHRTKATSLTSGEVDMSKAGVLNRTADNLSESATRKWAAESGAQVVTGKSLTLLVDRDLGNIADNATYGRTKLTALTAGEVDLSKAGVLNRTADNLSESATRKWAGESGADISRTRIAGIALVNGGFETGTNEGWNSGGSNGGTVVNAGASAKTGSYVMEVPCGAGGPNQFSNKVPISEGERVMVTAWARRKPTALPDAGVHLSVRIFDASAVLLSSTSLKNFLHTVDGWQFGRGFFIAPASASYFVIDLGESAGTTGAWWFDDVTITQTHKNLDDLPDSTTYGRTKLTALTSGEVDMTKAGVLNRTADNLSESATRKWAAESGAQVVTGKSLTVLTDRTLGNIADDATYGRTKLTALTSGEVDLSKAGVLNRSADYIAEATTRKWAAESGADVTSGKSLTVLTDRNLGNIADDATYGRVKLTALTTGEVDLSKAGVLNRSADNISEGTTRKWAAESGAQVVTGKDIGILADGATYGRTKLTALTSGEVDMTKSGVLNRNADNIAEATTRKWAAESGADVTSGKSVNVLADVKTVAQFFTFTQTITTTGAGSVTIPTGAKTGVIRAWGGCGSGSKANPDANHGGGGGGGGAKKTVVIKTSDHGGTISHNVGGGGTGVNVVGSGNAGTATTVTSSGLSFTNLNISANGGGAGTNSAGGGGGTASGGDTNTTGSAGTFGPASVGGNHAAIDSIVPGKGGNGTDGGTSQAGSAGQVSYTWAG